MSLSIQVSALVIAVSVFLIDASVSGIGSGAASHDGQQISNNELTNLLEKAEKDKTVADVEEGDICDVRAFNKPIPTSSSRYFTCMQPKSNDTTAWPWKAIGVWKKMDCAKSGYVYSPVARECKKRKGIRRSDGYGSYGGYGGGHGGGRGYGGYGGGYGGYGGSYGGYGGYGGHRGGYGSYGGYGGLAGHDGYHRGQYGSGHHSGYYYHNYYVIRPCQHAHGYGGAHGGHGGGYCSWMIDPLIPAYGNGQYYQQCVPKPKGVFCGHWLKRPCPYGTHFDYHVQVCVHKYAHGHGGHSYGHSHGHGHAGGHAASYSHGSSYGHGGSHGHGHATHFQGHGGHHGGQRGHGDYGGSHYKKKTEPKKEGETEPVDEPMCPDDHVAVGDCNPNKQCPGYSTCEEKHNVCCQRTKIN